MISVPMRHIQVRPGAGRLMGAVIQLTVAMCKTAHKHYLHHVVDLCCGLGPMGVLIWLIAGPGDSDGYMNPLPIPNSYFPIHPLYYV